MIDPIPGNCQCLWTMWIKDGVKHGSIFLVGQSCLERKTMHPTTFERPVQ